MPSARSTQPRLVTEPTTKPMLAPPRHSRMPTCTRGTGCCAWAPAKDATSMVAATPARMNERRMKKSPADECDASPLSQIATKALDAFAGVLEIGGLGGVGNAECRAEPERRTLHHRDAFVLQKLGDEILVVGDHLARRRSLADGAGAGRIDVERTLRPRTIDALGLIEHRHHEIAALPKHLVVHRDKVLRTAEGFDRRPLRDRRRV